MIDLTLRKGLPGCYTASFSLLVCALTGSGFGVRGIPYTARSCKRSPSPEALTVHRNKSRLGGERREGRGGDVMGCARGDAGGGWHRQVAKPGL